MAVSILLLLAGVVVLSAATRRPCLHVCTGPWHIWKAGHMTKPEGQETCKLRVTAEAQTPKLLRKSHWPHPHRSISRTKKPFLPLLSIVDQIRHFRSPPTLG